MAWIKILTSSSTREVLCSAACRSMSSFSSLLARPGDLGFLLTYPSRFLPPRHSRELRSSRSMSSTGSRFFWSWDPCIVALQALRIRGGRATGRPVTQSNPVTFRCPRRIACTLCMLLHVRVTAQVQSSLQLTLMLRCFLNLLPGDAPAFAVFDVELHLVKNVLYDLRGLEPVSSPSHNTQQQEQ